MADSMIVMKRVQKVIKRQAIIQDLHLAVEKSQVVALLGGNGAGKSTILRMLAGILHPNRGEITIGGRQWNMNRRAYAEQIGYMPDDFRFSPGLTARETLLFWAKLKGLSKEHVSEALVQVGLEHTGNKPVSSFSKGMRQRILFAQALLAHPPVVLMDEPTNGLDPYWMESFVRIVRQAASTGQTILFSTHQLQVAELLADRVVFLRNGAIALDGSAQQIRDMLGAGGLQDAVAAMYGISRTGKKESP
ncbi:ABC transporter ATP-binding protein [Xylanibacillus composti]|uniref:ABC transporter domain-containing protein n=1 Tax=Xylanibacillus composti TaxID=1572762 RepID=A0A8J4M2Z0_9BACL|nr:ABC transporter ATP-binding protein [Xylanibacillus composti]MDT9727000.1 ABC transporter ATP-binding protein [Xylanibacillus composti]GIQ69560.1 hypothetical protein XYCOK13_23840 [Xylanibacillus composti]